MKTRKFAIAVDITIVTVKHILNYHDVTARIDLIGRYTMEEAKKEIERNYSFREILSMDIKSDVRYYEISETDLIKYGKRLERNSQWPNHIS